MSCKFSVCLIEKFLENLWYYIFWNIILNFYVFPKTWEVFPWHTRQIFYTDAALCSVPNITTLTVATAPTKDSDDSTSLVFTTFRTQHFQTLASTSLLWKDHFCFQTITAFTHIFSLAIPAPLTHLIQTFPILHLYG